MGAARILGALLLGLVTGCASAPDPALTHLRDSPVPAGKARLVVMYPAPVMGSNGMVQIHGDTAHQCDLHSGGYRVEDITPGDKMLAFSFCGLPETSRLHLVAAAGKKYYILLLPYDSSLRGIISGYPGEFSDQGTPWGKGPFHIESVNEQKAFEELRALTPENREE